MNRITLRLGALGIALLACATAAHSASTIYSVTSACGNGYSPNCSYDYRFGDPAISSVSRPEVYSPPGGGGYNYAAEAAAGANAVDFSLYARAGGGTFSPHNAGGPGQFGMSATAQIYYHDEVTVAGSGLGTIVVPWHVTGGFNVLASSGDPYPPAGNFGVSFCQSIPVEANSGGLGCTGGSVENFNASGGYDNVLLLTYAIRFGMAYSLNTTFNLTVSSGAGPAVAMTGDFSHTGLQQPALVYDSNKNLILNPVITSASGVDYLNPQVSAVPAPASLGLLVTGILGLGWRTIRRVRPAN